LGFAICLAHRGSNADCNSSEPALLGHLILHTPSEKNSSYTLTVPFGTLCHRLQSFVGR
jgi:hypothetical protein